MNINVQSCSIDVPGGCPNKCKCCVSELHKSKKFMNNCLKDLDNITEYDRIFRQYRDRLAYIREKTDTVVLTGTASEPVFNKQFLRFFGQVNQSLATPFYNVEIQSAGIGMDEETLSLLDDIGVKTVALSLFSMDDVKNNEVQQSPKKLYYNIRELCARIKEWGFNLRVCYNLNIEGYGFGADVHGMGGGPKYPDLIPRLMYFAKSVEADQITLRKLYHNNDDSIPETVWVKENQLSGSFFGMLKQYIKEYGTYKRTLDFGADLYTIDGMSTVLDNDCMGKEEGNGLKYLILRRDIKIYSDWDDEGSLVF